MSDILKKPVAEDEKTRIKAVFDKYDKDKSGAIDLKELHDLLKDLGADMKDEEVSLAMKSLDKDNTMTCSFDEFLSFWSSDSKLGGYSNMTLQFMKAALAFQTKMDSMKDNSVGSKLLKPKGEIPEAGTVSFKVKTSISPGMIGCEPKLSVNVSVKPNEDKIIGLKAQMTAASPAAAEEVVQLFEVFKPMLADAPFKFDLSNDSDKVVFVFSVPEELTSEFDSSAMEGLKFFDSFLKEVNAQLCWSNDFEDLTKNTSTPLYNLLGAWAANAQVTCNMGPALAMAGDMPPFAKDLIESFQGADITVNAGYIDFHMKSFLSAFKLFVTMDSDGYRSDADAAFLKKWPNYSIADVRDFIFKSVMSSSREEFLSSIEEMPAEMKQMYQTTKGLSAKLVSIDSITLGLSPVASSAIVIDFQNMNPFALASFFMDDGNTATTSSKEARPQKEMSSAENEKLLAVFKKFDKDSSGKIDVSELKTVIAELGGTINEDEAAAAMKQLDSNGDGQCSFDEFKAFWCSTPGLGGYSSLALKFLKMKIAVEGAFKDGMTFLKSTPRSGKPVNDQDNTAVNVGVSLTPNMDPCDVKMSVSGRVSLSSLDGDRPSAAVRFLAKSPAEASEVADSLKKLFDLFKEQSGAVPPELQDNIKFEADGEQVIIKATTPEQVSEIIEQAKSFVEGWDAMASIAQAVRANYDVNFKVGLGSTFGDVVEGHDKQLVTLFKGAQVDVTVSLSPKTKFSLLSALSHPAAMEMFGSMSGRYYDRSKYGMIYKAIFSAGARLFAGSEVKVNVGCNNDALKKFFNGLAAFIGDLPPDFLTLDGLKGKTLETVATFPIPTEPEVVAVFEEPLKTVRSILGSLKSIHSVTVGPFVIPLPDHEGESPKVEVNIDFVNVSPFELINYIANPVFDKVAGMMKAPSAEATNEGIGTV